MYIFSKLFRGKSHFVILNKDSNVDYIKIQYNNGFSYGITNAQDLIDLDEIICDPLWDGSSYDVSFNNGNLEVIFDGNGNNKILFSCYRDECQRFLECVIKSNDRCDTLKFQIPLSDFEVFQLKYPNFKKACIGGFFDYNHPFEQLDYVYTNNMFIETYPMYLHIFYSADKENELKDVVKNNNLNWSCH